MVKRPWIWSIKSFRGDFGGKVSSVKILTWKIKLNLQNEEIQSSKCYDADIGYDSVSRCLLYKHGNLILYPGDQLLQLWYIDKSWLFGSWGAGVWKIAGLASPVVCLNYCIQESVEGHVSKSLGPLLTTRWKCSPALTPRICAFQTHKYHKETFKLCNQRCMIRRYK